jgi:putative redox protein
LAAAPQVPEAVAVATIGAPAEPAHVAHHFTHALADIEAKGEAEVKLGGRPFRIKKQFVEDIARYNSRAGIAALNKALIVFHSPQDAVVGIENARMIFEAAKHPKSFISLDDADHMLSQRADAKYVARVLAAWAELYIGLAEEMDQKRQAAKPAAVVVTETGANPAQGISPLTQSITIGRHRLTADEPTELGGSDLGPNPYDLLLSALGACTAMTLRLYAEHKGWSLEKVSVHLNHAKIHASDCRACETKDGRIDRIDRVVILEGQLDDAQRQRLLEIADKCPVHQTLSREIHIDTKPLIDG